ncbi:MAG TPA: hypothetical protein VIV11_15935 [Kofleriaceae bacterium]
MTRVATTGLALSFAIGCSDTTEAPQGSYAEAVYDNYEQAAGGKIDFEVAVIEEGALAAIAQRPLVEVLGGVAADWIVFEARGTELVQIGRGARNTATDEWTNPPALTDFDAMGYPVAQGAYRLFDVRATIDGVVTTHRSLEACWEALDHCVVVDPVVMQLDGYFQNRQRWLAEGWAPEIIAGDEPAEALDPDFAAATRYCKLSRYGTTSKRFSWPAKYAAGFNALGWKLYENHIGAQEVSIRCYVNSNGNCKAAASSSSAGSSCSTFFPGWSCDCDNIDHFGYTGSTARTAAQTKCVDNFGGASINAGISGSGASFSVSWTISSGSLYTNGGTYTDTCIWQ